MEVRLGVVLFRVHDPITCASIGGLATVIRLLSYGSNPLYVSAGYINRIPNGMVSAAYVVCHLLLTDGSARRVVSHFDCCQLLK